MNTGDAFDDLTDDFEGQAPTTESKPAPDFLGAAVNQAKALVICPSCHGSGNFHFRNGNRGECFKCGGTGECAAPRVLSQDPKNVAARMNAKMKAGETRMQKAAALREAIAAYKAEQPAVWAWLSKQANIGYGKTSEFAVSLIGAIHQYGCLTENQQAAVVRNIERAAERATERAAAAPDVRGSGFDLLLSGFNRARSKGLKRPTLRCVDELVFTLAPLTSKNPGCVYVKIGGNYKGKISPDGKFFAAYGIQPAEQEAIAEVARDPLAAAVAHGRKTGGCAICGRRLVDPVSVERAIGPICAENFGF